MNDVFGYVEPGVIVRQTLKPRQTLNLPFQVPAIIGEGPAYRTYVDVPIVRDANNTGTMVDTLPYTLITEIIGVGKVRSIYTYTQTTQYALTSPNQITWNAVDGIPAPGDTYYVTLEARPEDSQYDLKLITSFSDLDDEFQGFFAATDMLVNNALQKVVTLNPIYTGAYLALESGVKALYVQQVKPSGTPAAVDSSYPANPYGVVEEKDYETVLENYLAYQPRVYRITPLTINPTVLSQVADHINVYSDPAEKMERTAIVSIDTSRMTSVDALVSLLTTAATGYHNRRIILTYADAVTKKLGDGVFHDLAPFYLNAALAGVEGSLKPQNSLINFELRNFTTLKTMKMKRKFKNQIAKAGVTLFEQTDDNTPIIVRDWLTTDPSSPNSSSGSVTSIDDYIAKFLRARLNPYIGKYNITEDTIERIRKNVESALDDLKKDGVITNGSLTGLYQDDQNPQRLLLSVTADPAYPCGQIDVDLLLG